MTDRTFSRRAVAAGLVGVAAAAELARADGLSPAPPALGPAALPRVAVEIETAAGVRHRFRAELANTAVSRARGLMFRERLAPGDAMLFVYPAPTPASFWMRNTLIPLDMLFIAEGGRVIRVHRGAIPHDETPIPSGGPVRAVLEIAGGEAARRGLVAGAQARADDPRAFLPPLDAAAPAQ